MVRHVEVLVEEPSMEAALRAFLPKVLPGATFEIYPHQCKPDLLQNLPSRLRGYARWLPEDWRIVVVVDRDDDDCRQLKHRLDEVARAAGLRTPATAGNTACQVVTRIAIEELEAWYFGDWEAVRQAYPRAPATIPLRSRFRDPDGIRGGTWEAFERVLKASGYFRGGLPKIEVARQIAPHLDPARSTSRSFRCFASRMEEFGRE